jgi:hypothetical protein
MMAGRTSATTGKQYGKVWREMDEVMVVERVSIPADVDDGERTLAMGALPLDSEDRPRPEWVRGRCPECGDELVSNLYYVGGRGYLVRWECWASLRNDPQCGFYKVL